MARINIRRTIKLGELYTATHCSQHKFPVRGNAFYFNLSSNNNHVDSFQFDYKE